MISAINRQQPSLVVSSIPRFNEGMGATARITGTVALALFGALASFVFLPWEAAFLVSGGLAVLLSMCCCLSREPTGVHILPQQLGQPEAQRWPLINAMSAAFSHPQPVFQPGDRVRVGPRRNEQPVPVHPVPVYQNRQPADVGRVVAEAPAPFQVHAQPVDVPAAAPRVPVGHGRGREAGAAVVPPVMAFAAPAVDRAPPAVPVVHHQPPAQNRVPVGQDRRPDGAALLPPAREFAAPVADRPPSPPVPAVHRQLPAPNRVPVGHRHRNT